MPTGPVLAVQDDALKVRTAHHQPETSCALLEFVARAPFLAGGVTESLETAQVPLYIDHYAQHPAALPECIEAGLGAVAWVPLGYADQAKFFLTAIRADRGPRDAWRAADRALMDAAGRSVRAAFDRRALQDAAYRQARIDALTGIANRRAFDEDLQTALERKCPFTLMSIDLDAFKSVNDCEGHLQGDQVLRVFGQSLQREIGKSGNVYRTGGDEFAVLVEERTEEQIDQAVETAVSGCSDRHDDTTRCQ